MTLLCQRWSGRCATFRPPDPIDTSRYEVAAIPDDKTAKGFILEHHYSGSYPAARHRYGLYRGPQLQGVAVFSVPMNNAAITGVAKIQFQDGIELGRLVLLDEVPGNGETWFIARCFEQLRARGIALVVSFSDPVPRTTADGTTIFAGHIGTIYQAHNATYLGRGKRRVHRLLPDGRVLSPRSIQKIRAKERGWEYAAESLVELGADRPGEDLRAWSDHWIPRLTRPFAHGGNHKYAWAIDRRLRRHLPRPLPYPKQKDAA
jgi:hypothetical protein